MDRQGKAAAKTGTGAKRPAPPRSRARPTADKRSVEQRLADALAHQAATSEILRVMAASPSDVQPVLSAVGEQAARLCHAPFARIFLAEGDQLRMRAHHSAEGESPLPGFVVPLHRTSISGRAVLDRRTIHHADIVPLLESEFPSARENQKVTGLRAVLAVPLMRDSGAYGALLLWRREPGLFSPDQVALVETFATQAAIAIENVRQFHATQEALEQQTATSEILRVISSSPMDVQPVFDTIAANALRLCDARRAAIFRFDGKLIHIAAVLNLNPEGDEALRRAYPAPPSRESPTRRAILTASTVHIADVRADPEYRHQDVARVANFRSVLSVPMLRDGKPIGTISVYRDVVNPFADRQVELLKTFADQAVIAVENVRLFREEQSRTRELSESLKQQTATNEVLKAISRSTFDLGTVLQTLIESATQLCEADHGSITRQKGKYFYRAEFHGYPQEFMDYVKTVPIEPERGSATGRALLEGRVIHIPDVRADPEYTFVEAQKLADFRSILGVPMMREGVPMASWH